MKILLERFTKKKLQKPNPKDIRVEKVIKRKGNDLYGKWKGDDNSFDKWIDNKT